MPLTDAECAVIENGAQAGLSRNMARKVLYAAENLGVSPEALAAVLDLPGSDPALATLEVRRKLDDVLEDLEA